MQASSDPLDPHAVLGTVKAQPGNAGASRKSSATAGLDRPGDAGKLVGERDREHVTGSNPGSKPPKGGCTTT